MVLQYRAEIELGSVGLRIDSSGQARKPESQKANGAKPAGRPINLHNHRHNLGGILDFKFQNSEFSFQLPWGNFSTYHMHQLAAKTQLQTEMSF